MTATADRAKGALAAFIRWVMWRVDYDALYPAKVVSQNGDGTLEVQADNAKIGGLSRVPIRLGLPGAKVKVSGGARVLIGFENRDPASYIATLWESQDLVELDITASGTVKVNAPTIVLNNGAQAIAREGDIVQGVSTAPGTPFVGVIVSGNPTVLG